MTSGAADALEACRSLHTRFAAADGFVSLRSTGVIALALERNFVEAELRAIITKLSRPADGALDLVINVRDSHASQGSQTDGYLIRRTAVDFSVCLLTDVKLATLVVTALARGKKPTIKAWDQFGMYS